VEYLFTIAVLTAIYVVLASSLNVVVGHGGLLSLCHAGFYAVGAYASALAALRLGWAFPLSAAFGALFAAGIAALVALPLLKLKGDYFILGSLGFQIIIVDVIHNADAITNGALGLSGIPRPRFFGMVVTSQAQYAVAYAILAAASVAFLHYFTTSAFGRALNSVRDDDVAAIALGKDVRSIRIRALTLSAAGAGLAGAMYAHYVTYIDASSFTFTESVYILSLVIVGGVATTRGPILGAIVLVLAPELFRFVGFSTNADANIRQLLYGALLIAFAVLRPSGIAGRKVL
jgi:branched-chain amino acid transport system permease protein